MIYEDSAHAIFTLVMTSHVGAGALKLPMDLNSDFMPWCNARALSEVPNNFRPETGHRREFAAIFRSYGMKLAPATVADRREGMNPFAAEFIAQGILRKLGIRTASSRICSAREARALPPDFVVKSAGNRPAQGLNWNCADVATSIRFGWCLASQIVPDTASLDYIARTMLPSHSARNKVVAMLAKCAADHATKDRQFEELIAQALGKTCEPADKFFSGFHPTSEERDSIGRAMALDGDKYLRICAGRVFVGCSAPHASNVLVTREAQLISIDHARVYFERGDDLRMLFRFVRRDSRVFRILGEVAALTADDIRAAVAEIPKHPACGSTGGLADYYERRLELWKAFYSGHQENQQPSALGTKVLAVGALP
jgi:hypothetical protein